MTKRPMAKRGVNTPEKHRQAPVPTLAPVAKAALGASLPTAITVRIQSDPPAALKVVRQPGRDPKHLVVERAGEETKEETDARMIASPAVASSFITRAYSAWQSATVSDAVMAHDVVAAKIAAVQSGDMREIEAMLVGGACALQTVATEFLRRASLCLDSPAATEIYMRVALRAISQQRANCEAVAEIKNPRPVFAKQTNIANGSQQVNNATGPQQVNNAPRAGENEPAANKLLENV